jgi:ATP-dependent Clp protease ATP-binding subunit ClpA
VVWLVGRKISHSPTSWFKSFWNKLAAPSGAEKKTFTSEFELTSNFTPRAQQALALARKEADRSNHNFVGTEHLLLGLIKLGQGVAVNVLQKLGLDLETVRAEVEKQVGAGPGGKIFSNIPYTPRVKKVLDFPRKEAKALNHTYVGTEHILLGLLREGEGVAARILRHLDVNIEKTRQDILQELDPNFVPPASPSSTPNSGQAKSAFPQGVASLQPQGEPVDTSKRYDVYCTDWSQGNDGLSQYSVQGRQAPVSKVAV